MATYNIYKLVTGVTNFLGIGVALSDTVLWVSFGCLLALDRIEGTNYAHFIFFLLPLTLLQALVSSEKQHGGQICLQITPFQSISSLLLTLSANPAAG